MSVIDFKKSKKKQNSHTNDLTSTVYDPKPFRGSKKLFKQLRSQFLRDNNKSFRRVMNGFVVLFILGLLGLFYMNQKQITFKNLLNL